MKQTRDTNKSRHIYDAIIGKNGHLETVLYVGIATDQRKKKPNEGQIRIDVSSFAVREKRKCLTEDWVTVKSDVNRRQSLSPPHKLSVHPESQVVVHLSTDTTLCILWTTMSQFHGWHTLLLHECSSNSCSDYQRRSEVSPEGRSLMQEGNIWSEPHT